MQPTHTFLPGVVALFLSLGCSGGDVGGEPIGSGGSGTVGTAGNAGLAPSTAGTNPGVGGTAPVASTSSQGGVPNGNGGTAGASQGGSAQGGTSQGGSAQGGSAQGGSAQGGSGGAVPTDGKGLYEANCLMCHAEQGAGSVLGPAIVHPVRDYSTWVVRNGRPLIDPWKKAMDKFGTDKLSDAQLTLIWDYLDQPPQPTTGAALFADYCANCHGADGAGGPTMRKLAGEGKNVLKLVREGKSVGQYAMRHDSMPKFDTKRITDAELNLILAHVNTF